MDNTEWVTSQVSAWWATLRMKRDSSWNTLVTRDIANGIVTRDDREEIAHHLNTLAMTCWIDRASGDPFVRWCSKVQSFFEQEAVMAKKAAAATKAKESLDVPVAFKSFGYGGGRTCRLGIHISEEVLSEKFAKHYLGGAQLKCVLVADPNSDGDTPGQGKLVDDVEAVEAVADCKGYGYSDKHFTGSLCFAFEDVDAEALLSLAGTKGRLVAERTGDATTKRGRPKKDADEDGDDFEGE